MPTHCIQLRSFLPSSAVTPIQHNTNSPTMCSGSRHIHLRRAGRPIGPKLDDQPRLWQQLQTAQRSFLLALGAIHFTSSMRILAAHSQPFSLHFLPFLPPPELSPFNSLIPWIFLFSSADVRAGAADQVPTARWRLRYACDQLCVQGQLGRRAETDGGCPLYPTFHVKIELLSLKSVF